MLSGPQPGKSVTASGNPGAVQRAVIASVLLRSADMRRWSAATSLSVRFHDGGAGCDEQRHARADAGYEIDRAGRD